MTQTVKIETLTPAGKVVDGAKCVVTNDRNDAVVRSGQSLPVRRSGANLTIECTQPGYAPANGQAISRANVGLAGNILLGGVVGAVIDTGTGAGFNYPSWIQMIFGEARSFDRSAQTGDQPTMGMKIGSTELAAVPKTATSPVPAPTPVPAAPVPAPTPPVAMAPAAPAAPPGQAPAPAPTRPETRVSMDDLGGLLPAKP